MKDHTDVLHLSDLSNISIVSTQSGFVVALIDKQGFEIVKGHVRTVSEAINEMHSNLI